MRKLTDPKTMRALAHPVRLALLEALAREGPLTATQAADLLDDSPGNMSWHLQTLAKYGFVEEGPGGRGRSRPWCRVTFGNRWDDDPDNRELEAVGTSLSQVEHERTYQRLREWLTSRTSYSATWRRAWFSSTGITYLTPEELDELGHEMTALIMRYRERVQDRGQRPAGAMPVHLVAFGHPLPPSPTGN
jgi:DNA-binding transcriptional ArsR family regulator